MEADGDERKEHSEERLFDDMEVPGWGKQLTFRAFAASLVIGFFMSLIVMKLNLTTGIIPSLNITAGLLGFFMIKVYTKILEKLGLLKQPFTRQENTVIQTCVVAIAGIAFSSGCATYLLGMSSRIAAASDSENTAVNTKELSLGWMIGFLLSVSFVGLCSVVPLRKIMIIEYKLLYPSGTATAILINSFHTPQGAERSKKQVSALFKSFGASFSWSFFQWFFTAGDGCGFQSFPSLGLQAYKNRFYFDFSATYVGVGMICPYMVNISLLIGAIISWGILWPYIESKKGHWYSADLSPGNYSGLMGYKVFISIAMILGDGFFHFAVVLYRISRDVYARRKKKDSVIPVTGRSTNCPAITYDESRRTTFFLKDQIPLWVAGGGYVLLAIISLIAVPFIFPQLKRYHIVVAYIIAPVLAFCNSYGCGLTDWSLASSYGKIAIFIIGAWSGLEHGGIIAGLAACGLMMSIVSTASDLMQDFRTGYLTLASPRAMFVSQVAGTAMGCVIAPCVFWIFYSAFPLGDPDGEYPAPFAALYRNIALVGVEGLKALPKNCLNLCIGFFLAAVAINSIREFAKHKGIKAYKYIPNAMGMAIPFYLGSYFAIDMCLGSLILFLWEKKNKAQADAFAPAIASGMICGDGIWSLPASILAMAKVNPPICMKFLSRATNAKVDAYLSGN